MGNLDQTPDVQVQVPVQNPGITFAWDLKTLHRAQGTGCRMKYRNYSHFSKGKNENSQSGCATHVTREKCSLRKSMQRIKEYLWVTSLKIHEHFRNTFVEKLVFAFYLKNLMSWWSHKQFRYFLGKMRIILIFPIPMFQASQGYIWFWFLAVSDDLAEVHARVLHLRVRHEGQPMHLLRLRHRRALELRLVHRRFVPLSGNTQK